MKLLDCAQYREEVSGLANSSLDWERLNGQTILITGATGMIASCLVDALMMRNQTAGMDCRILAVGRSEDKARDRFGQWFGTPWFSFLNWDINQPEDRPMEHVDYVLHAASNTHPVAYATDPIGTVTANVIGLHNMLELASAARAKRVVFLSSVEIYGENRGDTDCFREDYCGYIDCNTLRAGYPESKRTGEALCQAYIKQKNLDIVIPRLARVYGPTLLKTDTKALSQFLKNAVANEDIILKSQGMQYYSYLHVYDAISGIMTCLLKGKCGEAYNVSDPSCDVRLRDLATLIANAAGRKVVFQIPDAIESAGFSKATMARMNSAKLQSLGWKAALSLPEGINRTINILREAY